MKSPETLEEIIEDVEDLLAHRMELALMGSWTVWKTYKIQNGHRELPRPVGAKVEVRFQFVGAVYMNVEVRYYTREGWTTIWPEANDWWFPGLEDEAEARITREANDKPLRAY